MNPHPVPPPIWGKKTGMGLYDAKRVGAEQMTTNSNNEIITTI